jgi:Na+/pantothenate symporter
MLNWSEIALVIFSQGLYIFNSWFSDRDELSKIKWIPRFWSEYSIMALCTAFIEVGFMNIDDPGAVGWVIFITRHTVAIFLLGMGLIGLYYGFYIPRKSMK